MQPDRPLLLFRKFITRTPDGEREIEVARSGRGFRIRDGGREAEISWSDLEGGRALVTIDDRPLEVRIHTAPDGSIGLEWKGQWFSLRVEDDLSARARAAHSQHSGPFPLRTPMPGLVVRVLVEEGATVTQEQPLLILEAMKMQNEINAPIAGTIETLEVKPGQAVEADQVLLRIRG